MKQAAILAGGRGTRLSQIFGDLPKPMVPIAGRPVLEHILENLKINGITDFVFFTGYLHEKIESHFGDGARFGVRIRYVREPEPLGSAGSLVQHLAILDDIFLVVYGDTLFDIELAPFLKRHHDSSAGITLFLHPNDHPYDSDLVDLGPDGLVRAFHKYPHPEGAYLPNLVNAALYIVNRRALAAYVGASGALDFGRDIFPRLLQSGRKIAGYVSREYIKDMGTPERRERVEKDLQSGKVKRARLTNSKPAVFIDRDGTLTKSNDYVRSPEALEVFEFAGRALSRLNRSEYLSILVTNQPVLARGELDERGLREIHNKLETELGQGRAYLDALYYCPHHPDKGFAGEVPELKTDCACRKPKTGMIDQAARELNVDLKGSWLIGDTTTDVATAKNAGLRSILVRTGYGGRDRKHKLRPDFEVADFEEAVTFILEDFERLQRIMKPIVDRLKPGQHVIVGGPARSGKSLVASTLRRMLHTKATVISLDGWLKPEAQRGPTVDSRYDLAAFSRFLSGLSSARELVLPYYDRHTRTLDAEGFREPFDPKESLVFEGTIALAVPDLVKLNSVKVFVEASRETRWARFQKEYRLRGWSEGQIEQTFKARESEEIPFIMKTKAAADVALALDEAK